MSDPKAPDERFTRRKFMELSAVATAVGAGATFTGCSKPAAPNQQVSAAPEHPAETSSDTLAKFNPPASAASDSAPAAAAASGHYNILLILVDQERYFQAWPFPVPGRERLRTMGVSFENHQINSNVCSPSRSVLYTGQHIQHTGVFDNVNAPWQPSMSHQIPTLGTMLRELGYYTAYKGKFHSSRCQSSPWLASDCGWDRVCVWGH